uniref:ATP synthase complex subunit 8 n=1 Tax=Tephritis femoralis TaxID=594077 RepID=A0A6G7WDP3_9MUSC|nr:ATP synthase F0 subunit 8 [Tephritis femoralis]QIK50379.1 ATP synthase F0 subunit 8 [Tephritis femoralis]
MPQMAPISWLTLFIIFSITLILYSIMNYYLIIYQTPKFNFKNKLIKNSLNWKW